MGPPLVKAIMGVGWRGILAYKINPSFFVLCINEVLEGFNKIGFNFIPRFSNVAAVYLVELGLVSVDDIFFFFFFIHIRIGSKTRITWYCWYYIIKFIILVVSACLLSPNSQVPGSDCGWVHEFLENFSRKSPNLFIGWVSPKTDCNGPLKLLQRNFTRFC